jgi:hypothetical protein
VHGEVVHAMQQMDLTLLLGMPSCCTLPDTALLLLLLQLLCMCACFPAGMAAARRGHSYVLLTVIAAAGAAAACCWCWHFPCHMVCCQHYCSQLLAANCSAALSCPLHQVLPHLALCSLAPPPRTGHRCPYSWLQQYMAPAPTLLHIAMRVHTTSIGYSNLKHAALLAGMY